MVSTVSLQNAQFHISSLLIQSQTQALTGIHHIVRNTNPKHEHENHNISFFTKSPTGMKLATAAQTCDYSYDKTKLHNYTVHVLHMLVTVFISIDNMCSSPGKQKVSYAGTERHSDAQVDVVSHEDQHEEVTHHHLYDVQ